MTQEKLERMKASIKEAAEKRKTLKEAGEMPLVNEAPTPVVNDPIADPAPVETAPVETAPAAPAEPAAAPESFTPPAPGMVPSGWVRPEDLASVVTAAQDEQDATAQVTGDVEAAQSVEIPGAPAGSEIATSAEPVVESMLPKDGERKTPVSAEEEVAQEEELAKKKMKESEEDDEDEEVDEEEADEEEEEVDEEDSEDEDVEEDEESEDEVVNDEEVDEVKDYFEPPFGELELVSDGDQMQADVLALTSGIEDEEDEEEEEEEEIPSTEEIFDNSNFLDKLEAFFDDKDSEDVADLAAALHDSADFLDYLIGGSDEEEMEVEDEEEFEESSGRIPFKKSECDEPKHKDIRARIAKHRAMQEAVKYPAGSEPEASQIANARRQQQVEEENLVKTYEEKLQARRDALRKVRENIKRTRNVNAAAEPLEDLEESTDRFKKAIRGRLNEENAPRKKTDSWEDNKFIDRYTERQKFNFRDLLNGGTITNLLG